MIWYTLATALFRCPAKLDQLDDHSPKLCEPYLIARTYTDPYIRPYYNTYAEPYVAVVRPYVHTFNDKVYSPASGFAKNAYTTYGAPRVESAKEFGLAQWEQTIQPQLDSAYGEVVKAYDASLAPHVEKVSAAAGPYYTTARDNAMHIHENHVLPAYISSKPYAAKAYSSGSDIAFNVILPQAQKAWSSAVFFIDAELWPRLRGLYGENVEPQLVRIGERLSNYREGKKLSAMVEEVESSIAASTPTIDSIVASTESTVIEETPMSETASISPSSSSNSAETIAKARPVVEKDLQSWQEKFAVAADKGAEDLQDNVREIIESYAETSIKGEGEGLVKALELQVEREVTKFKDAIVAVVTKLPEDVTEEDEETAEGEVFAHLKTSGVAIRDRAQALRAWYSSFGPEADRRASVASESTLEVLNSIRNLGLQEIGMRWAWMDGVTYKDWAKYHALKKQFLEWRDEVRDVAVKHAALEKAKDDAHDVLDHGMASAEEAAKELTRLKDVARWKIRARDTTDDFETRAIPASVARASKKVAEGLAEGVAAASDNIVGTSSQGAVESVVSEAAESAASVASEASEAVIGTSTGTVEAATSSVASSAASVASSASEAANSAVGAIAEEASSASSAVAESVSSLSSAATEAASEIASSVSDSPSSASSALEEVTETAEEAITEASEEAANIAEAATESAGTIIEDATEGVEQATETPKKVWGGVAAQSVPKERKPILDDVFDDDEEESFSSKLQSVVSAAGDRYAEATKAVSEALLKPSATKGTAESAVSVASDQYSSALAAASSVLYGTPQSPSESVVSVAHEKYQEAVAA